MGPRNRGTRTEAITLLGACGCYVMFSKRVSWRLLQLLFMSAVWILSADLPPSSPPLPPPAPLLLLPFSSSFLSSASSKCFYSCSLHAFLLLLLLLYLILFLSLYPSPAPHPCCTGQLVFSSDETAGYSSLYHLLWCAVTDDFEVRSKAVALLVG